MFINIWDTDKELSPKKFGVTIANLSRVEKKTNLQLMKTIVLSKQTFRKYYQDRYVSNDIIDSAENLLKEHGVLWEAPVFIAISVYRECLIPTTHFIIKNNFTSIQYAITKLYEAWFDDKPQAYRIANKMNKEDTFPAIYIQPFMDDGNIFSVVTRNPVDGSLLRSYNYQHNVHCKLPVFNEIICNMIDVIDDVFAIPKKIFFRNDEYGNINIIKVREYPITKKGYLSVIVEKHRKKHISNKEFLDFISPEDLLKFDGYTLDVTSQYKQAQRLNWGCAQGRVVFVSTNLQMLREKGMQGPYILITDIITPEELEIVRQCSGAIFNTTRMSSHGALVCKGMGLPAIADKSFSIDNLNKTACALGRQIHEGDFICICAFEESGWSLEERIIPKFKLQVDRQLYSYLNEVLYEYDDRNLLSECDIKFQLHYAEIKEAIKKLGAEYECIAH